MVTLDELRDVAIRVFNDLHNPDVTLLSVIPLVNDQPVNLVEDKYCFYLGFPCLTNYCRSLRADAFDYIDHDDCAVR